MKPSDFIHPEDAAALQQMESIPGFPALVKKFYALGYEKLYYGTNMASNIRLSEKQLRRIFIAICRRFAPSSASRNLSSILK